MAAVVGIADGSREEQGVSLTFPAGLKVLMANSEVHLLASSRFAESRLTFSSEELDVGTVQVDIIPKSVCSSSSSSYHNPAYDELVELMTCATAKLSLDMSGPKQEISCSCVDK